MSVRRRLLLGTLGILVLLLMIIGAVEVVGLRNYVYGAAEQRERDAVAEVVNSLGEVPPDAVNTPAVASLLADRLAAKGLAVEVQSGDGSVLAERAAGYPYEQLFSVPSKVSVPADGSGSTVVEDQGRGLMLVGVRLNAPGAPVIVVAQDLSSEDSTVRKALLATVIGGGAALLLTAAVALALLRGGLRPLRTVAETADRIAAGDLAQRAELPHTDDEVGRLGQAFDQMVDRVQQSLEGLRTANTRLREQEAATRRFVGDASHELRTPLTAIRGQAQVLLRGGHADADTQEAVAHIAAESERMSRLVDDLLLLSRADSGLPAGRREPVDLARLVQQQQDRWASALGAPDVRVQVSPAVVQGDPEQLQRLVDNLVSNAVRYAGAAQIEVTVTASDGQALLRVRDHGPGLPPGERERVFERFYRSGNTGRARAAGGTGLGLAIVRAIATEHGGSARFVDVEGEGAAVEVTLSLAADAPLPSAFSRPRRTAPATDRSAGRTA